MDCKQLGFVDYGGWTTAKKRTMQAKLLIEMEKLGGCCA
jgi:hypothetical protein